MDLDASCDMVILNAGNYFQSPISNEIVFYYDDFT
jgi:hypothetical protein